MAVFRLNQSHLGKIQSEVPPTLTHQATTSNSRDPLIAKINASSQADIDKHDNIDIHLCLKFT